MNRPIVRGVAAAILFAALPWDGPVSSQAGSEVRYAVRYLGSLGGANSRGNSINNDGWISGYSDLAGGSYRHAALWRGDALTDLGTLGSPQGEKNSVVAWPVKNTLGLVVGIAQTNSPDPWGENWSCFAFFPAGTSTGFRCVGFVWEAGVMRPLPTLGGTHGYAAAANNVGQIVGWAENTVRDPTCTPPQVFQFRAVAWGPDGSHIRELPVLPGDTSSAATAINDKGQIVGISGTCDDAVGSATAAHAVIWENGTVTDIGNLGGAEWNTPTAINENGTVVGFSDHPGDLVTEAFIWTKESGVRPLGWLNGHGHSEAHGINNRGEVVGLSCSADFADCRAVIWQDDVIRDLNELVSLNENEVLTHAQDINDHGVITGRSLNTVNNERPAFEATPLPAGQAALVSRIRAGHPRARVKLTAEAAREILWPLGPGRARLDGRVR